MEVCDSSRERRRRRLCVSDTLETHKTGLPRDEKYLIHGLYFDPFSNLLHLFLPPSCERARVLSVDPISNTRKISENQKDGKTYAEGMRACAAAVDWRKPLMVLIDEGRLRR